MIFINRVESTAKKVFWSYGEEFEVPISKRTCLKLDVKPPKMGYDVVVKTAKVGNNSILQREITLVVVNISGILYLRSASAETYEWPELFGIQVD